MQIKSLKLKLKEVSIGHNIQRVADFNFLVSQHLRIIIIVIQVEHRAGAAEKSVRKLQKEIDTLEGISQFELHSSVLRKNFSSIPFLLQTLCIKRKKKRKQFATIWIRHSLSWVDFNRNAITILPMYATVDSPTFSLPKITYSDTYGCFNRKIHVLRILLVSLRNDYSFSRISINIYS